MIVLPHRLTHAHSRYEACVSGNAKLVEELVNLGADVNRAKFNEWTPLHFACAKGLTEICSVLLRGVHVGADCACVVDRPNKEGSTALNLACREGHVECVQALLDTRLPNLLHRNKNQRTPWQSAVACEDGQAASKILTLILKHDPNHLTEQFLTLIDSTGSKPLHDVRSPLTVDWLSQNVPHLILQNWIQHKNKAGRNPLHLASENDDPLTFRALLKIADSFNLLDELLNANDDQGQSTPLIIASAKGHARVVFEALQFDADDSLIDGSGKTALQVARAWKKPLVVQVLERRLVFIKNVQTPTLFFGTYKLNGDECYNAVLVALRDFHYRALDTAEFYQNEVQVGRAIRDSGVPRKDLFVLTKVWNSNTSSGHAVQALKQSLINLQLDYLDLILVHWPCHGYERAFQDLEDCCARGLVRAVGVSNFLPEHFHRLWELYKICPAVNQIEMSVFFHREEQVRFFKRQGCVLQAYRSLGIEGFVSKNHFADANHPVVLEIAIECGASPQQVLLRWVLQSGSCVLPKSKNAERIELNSKLFFFHLTRSQMSRLAALALPNVEQEWMKNVYKPSSEKDIV